MTLTALVRPNIRTLTPYQSARRIGGKGDVWLNANEYPQAQAITLMLDQLNRYPECQPSKVINAYAKYAKVSNNQVIMTRGADEGIELLMRAFCQPDNLNDAVVYCPPTYGMYAVSANTLGIPTKTVVLTDDWQLDLDELYKVLPQSKIIYLCSPNNPTGNLLNIDDITTLLDKCINTQIIVVDEAYIEFCPQATVVNLLKQYSNLVILRTLSKAFALAGIRCGFILANAEVIEILAKVIAPYPVPTPVALIAEQALSISGIEQMNNNVNFIVKERELLIKALQQCACIEKVFPSESNYILIKERNNADIFKTLWQQGIILRDQNQQVNLKRCIRITIGTQQENQAVISAIKKIN